MQLSEVVEKYLVAAGGYGKSAPISALGISHQEAERAFDVLDEDYHISRFFRFSNTAGEIFQVNGFPQTHIAIDAEIQEIL